MYLLQTVSFMSRVSITVLDFILTESHSGQEVSVNVTRSTSNSSSCNLLCTTIVSRLENFKSHATHTQIFLLNRVNESKRLFQIYKTPENNIKNINR